MKTQWKKRENTTEADQQIIKKYDELADAALKAQAKEIAKLTESREAWKGIQEGTARLLKEKEARIAELEAALKQIADNYNKPTTSKDGLAFIARAALEKSDGK